MKSIPEEKRPTCSCGAKMLVVKYKGYYDEFNFFMCDSCNLDEDDYAPDSDIHGSYVF